MGNLLIKSFEYYIISSCERLLNSCSFLSIFTEKKSPVIRLKSKNILGNMLELDFYYGL